MILGIQMDLYDGRCIRIEPEDCLYIHYFDYQLKSENYMARDIKSITTYEDNNENDDEYVPDTAD